MQYYKRYRLKKRILEMLRINTKCVFLTFTFNDKTLNKTTTAKRERIIKNYLNRNANEYILNCDFGTTNEREHYHAIATPKADLFKYDSFIKYGYLQRELIGVYKRFKNINKSLEDIAERLTEHATKESTKNSRIIYSRRNYKYIEIDDIKESAKAPTEEETKAQKRINEDKAEEITEEEIKHPKLFYYTYDKSLIYQLSNKIDNNTFIYVASKYDIFNGIQQYTHIYDKKSQVYKAYINRNSNNNIVFDDIAN